MNHKAQATISTFVICFAIIIAIFFTWFNLVNEGNINYGTSESTSLYANFSNNSELVDLSHDLNDQFSGINQSASTGSTVGDSFNQVYTLGVVTTRIVSTVTPGLFAYLFSSLGTAMGIPSFYVAIGVVVIVLLLIAGFFSGLLGRQF